MPADRLGPPGRAAPLHHPLEVETRQDAVFHGAPEQIETTQTVLWKASLFDLLSAYARQRQTQALGRVSLKKREVWSLAQAREALERLAGVAREWTVLDDFLIDYCVDPEQRRTARASSFSASLEMVREGRIDLRQDGPFTPIWLRARAPRLVVAAESPPPAATL